MSKFTLYQGLLRNLEGKIPKEQKKLYLPKEEAYRLLKKKTGQDFGYDSKAWGKWCADHKKR